MLIFSISKENELNNIPKWVEWIELRLDLTPSLITSISDLDHYKVIITDRLSEEGGKSKRSYVEKLSFYQSLSYYSNLYFDIEIGLLDNDFNINIDNKRIILSYHSFQALDLTKVQDKLDKAKAYKPYFIKIAQHCSSVSDLSELYQLIQQFEEKILWLVMGDYGKLQRLLYKYLESLGTYIASDGAETVSGQLNVSDVEKYQHFLARELFKWGGIIGGEQVYSSLGLYFYNNYFRNNKIDACYLPLNIKEADLSDFFNLISINPKLSKNCFGFSLTMPFKQTIPKLFNHQGISNLLIYGVVPRFYNTDQDAFLKIKKRLDAFSIKKVLIYGSGSMAEMALTIFDNYDITLTARNPFKLEKLKGKRKNIEIIDQITSNLYVDLLINTSPLGMKGEDFSRETGIRKFKYVIDLPYSQAEIPLQKEVGEDNYISGREFWLYQSERQLQLFKERIEND